MYFIKTHKKQLVILAIVVVSVLMHFPHFSKDIIDVHAWRQTQTQSNIEFFYKSDMDIFNPRRNVMRLNGDNVFRMEFPLMQWLVAWVYKIFGDHLIITRISMFIIGLLSTWGIYKLVKALFKKENTALVAAWALTFSPCFYYYTLNPLPDNMALCTSIWGIAAFFQWYNYKKRYSLFLSGIFLSIAALCKLPFIVYYIIPIIYFINEILLAKGLKKDTFYNALLLFSFSILPVAWYLYVIPGWGDNMIVQGMFNNETPWLRILDYAQHNLISTMPELLVNYGSLAFFLAGFYFLYKNKKHKGFKFTLLLWWGILVLLYFTFEINAIAKVHDYYLFPFIPLLFVIVAYGAQNLIESKQKALKYISFLLLFLLPFTCYIRVKNRWNPEKPGFNKDLLLYKEELKNAVPKDALVIAGNDISFSIFLYHIDKKGSGFYNDKLMVNNQLKILLNQGVKYLYSDSRKFESNDNVKDYLDDLILEKGSIRVYTLKNPE